MSPSEFIPFPKIARWNREVVVTEKIDGTNSSIHIDDDGLTIRVGSRNRWITPEDDNYGFAGWVARNSTELLKLGPGSHYGEWWGNGIQRKYDMKEKVFSLFNVGRWTDNLLRPSCCLVVPTLWVGSIGQLNTNEYLDALRSRGSVAAPGFMRPEGIVIYHTAARVSFKRTLEKDDKPKGSTE